MIEPIRAAEDPRLAPYKMMRDGDLLRAHNLCILEGKTVISHAIKASRFPIKSLLIAQHKLHDCQELIQQTKAEILTAPSSILDDIVGFKFHRGIVALAHRSEPVSNMPEHGLALALCGINNHDNMGAIFRSAAALGANAIHMDKTCCDPLYRKAIRVSSGTVLSLPFKKHEDMRGMIADLKTRNYRPIAMAINAQTNLADYKPDSRKTLIVLGNEGTGLPEDVIAECEAIKIPMASSVDSLNVAASAAIVIYTINQMKQAE